MPRAETGGGIIRVAHNKDNPYTLINRTFTDDPALSWEARGLLAYLLCKPDNWTVRFTDLERRGEAGREKLRRMLRELSGAGYLVRTRSHNPATGQWTWESVVYETPSAGLPSMGEPSVAEPPRAEPPIYSVATVTSSNGNEYRADAAPIPEDVPAVAALRRRNPPATAVQAGTVPSGKQEQR